MPFRKKIYAAGGFTTLFLGPGRPEFDPTKPLPTFETYLKETAEGTLKQIPSPHFDEGVIGSFMSGRFIKQANLPGFLPFMVPDLVGKPCVAVEGACGTGGKAIATAIKSLLSDLADSVFVAGFEMQNGVKSVYGADILAGAAYYQNERKSGQAFFFPGIFAERAGAYYKKYGEAKTREAMARWYEQMILHARKNKKAQEFHNKNKDLLKAGMTAPNAETFLPYINLFDCSKVSDGAASIGIFSEEGLKKNGIPREKAVEIIAMGEAEADITQAPDDPTRLITTETAVKKALNFANVKASDLGIIEVHDCFTITGLLALEAIGLAEHGKAPETKVEIPINASGGLCGFGHPTGASGVRQLVDLEKQLTGQAENQQEIKKPLGLMISMGGNDKTVTAVIVKP